MSEYEKSCKDCGCVFFTDDESKEYCWFCEYMGGDSSPPINYG